MHYMVLPKRPKEHHKGVAFGAKTKRYVESGETVI